MISSYHLYLIYTLTMLIGILAIAASVILFLYGSIQFITLSANEDGHALRAFLFMLWVTVVFGVTVIFGITGVVECRERMKGLVGE
jgi:uncharacterized membrane protein YdbT with pleckstrin-like domain